MVLFHLPGSSVARQQVGYVGSSSLNMFGTFRDLYVYRDDLLTS